MKKVCFIFITLILSCNNFNNGSLDETDTTDYSYYYPSEIIEYIQAPGYYSNNNSFSIKDNKDNILDFPIGGGDYAPNNESIISLGEAGGSVTVKFDSPIVNKSMGNGFDFIVYGNVLLMGGDSATPFIEPGFVEVSTDNETWYLLVADNSLTSITKKTRIYNLEDYNDRTWPNENTNNSMTLTTWESSNYGDGYGYCEINTTKENLNDENKVTFYANPDIRGGGDPFKLEWAVDDSFNSVNLNEISYIRITTGMYPTESQTEIDSIIRIEYEQI